MIIDLNGTGVKVTNVDPGLVETEFSIVRFHGDEDRAKEFTKDFSRSRAQTLPMLLFMQQLVRHRQIQEIFLTPTDQATATIVNKKLN